MRNISLSVSYDGTAYHGWQYQPNVITVQETLQKTVERIINRPVKLYGGARTDTGVHAQGQVVNFHSDTLIDLKSLEKGINSLLPSDVKIKKADEMPEDFHSRYSAKSKTYIYCILNTPHNSPFYGRYAWHIRHSLDISNMGTVIRNVKGVHDFSAFKKQDETYRSTEREVLRAGVGKRNEFVYVVLEATGFLRYMVRNIVGTLVLAGFGRLTAEGFRDIMESGDRRKAGSTAPAKGLFLKEIIY
ncbi:MAG: tRNA pseudouridine(38-40) synthase TruA [Syntrophobacterales bacterium]|jgi:tRNA pseudouridine38-40 synthase|nr:tRNA pseudouridine(38-40) synthase TruA [Syntrophobacterales bacterium]